MGFPRYDVVVVPSGAASRYAVAGPGRSRAWSNGVEATAAYARNRPWTSSRSLFALRLRRQLPVYSPITAPALRRVAGRLLRSADEVEARLSARLAQEYDAEAVQLFGSGTQALQVALRGALRRDPSTPRKATPSAT